MRIRTHVERHARTVKTRWAANANERRDSNEAASHVRLRLPLNATGGSHQRTPEPLTRDNSSSLLALKEAAPAPAARPLTEIADLFSAICDTSFPPPKMREDALLNDNLLSGSNLRRSHNIPVPCR